MKNARRLLIPLKKHDILLQNIKGLDDFVKIWTEIMNKKEKLSFLMRQFRKLRMQHQQKIRQKENEQQAVSLKDKVKMFTLNHTGTLRKAFAGMALLSSFSMGARGETEETSLNSIDNTKNKIAYAQKHLAEQIKLSGNTYFSGTKDYIPLAQLENVKSGGYYNGVYIDFSKVRPEDVVHAFESGNNPTILNYGATSIKNAKYLGDYQFNLNNTIYELVKYCRKDFPELAKAAGVDPETGKIIARNARTDRFYQTYCDLCEGEQAEKFARLKFGFMFETHYKPVFQKLHQTFPDFPEITPENYTHPENFLLAAQVMSTSTQSPGKAFSIIKRQIEAAKAEALKNNQTSISPLDVYTRVSNFKSQNWGHKLRYQKENGLASDINDYFNAQAEILARQNDMMEEIHPVRPATVILADNTVVAKLQKEAKHKISSELYTAIKAKEAKTAKGKSARKAAAKLLETFLAFRKEEKAPANPETTTAEENLALAEATRQVKNNKSRASSPVKAPLQTKEEVLLAAAGTQKKPTVRTITLNSGSVPGKDDETQPVPATAQTKTQAKKAAADTTKAVKKIRTSKKNVSLASASVQEEENVKAEMQSFSFPTADKASVSKSKTLKKIKLSNAQTVKLKIAKNKSDFRKNQKKQKKTALFSTVKEKLASR